MNANENQNPGQNLETQRKRREQRLLPLFFRALIFLLERQVRNIDTLPWMKPPGAGGPNRTHLSFVFLCASVPPWCEGLVFWLRLRRAVFPVFWFCPRKPSMCFDRRRALPTRTICLHYLIDFFK